MKIANYSMFYKDLKNHGLEYAAKHTRALGFDAVEFLEILPNHGVSVCDRYTVGDAKRILDENGLRVSCFSVCVDLAYGEIESSMQRMMRLIDFAAGIGSPRIHHTLFPSLNFQGFSEPYEQILKKVYPNAVQIANAAAAYGMECLYEPQGCCFNGVAGLQPFLEKIKRECSNTGICGDVANGLFADASVKDIYDAFIDDIRHVHVKDYRVTDRPDPDTTPYVSRGGKCLYDCPIGEGVTDFRYCFEKLKTVDYRGDISFEIFGTDQEILQAISYLKNIMKEVCENEI